jgi:hypothetical protein
MVVAGSHVAAWVVSVLVVSCAGAAELSATTHDPEPLLEWVSQLTGANATVPTLHGADVWGCDLGMVAEHPTDSTVLVLVFGDTFGAGSLPGNGRKEDWRSNTMASFSRPLRPQGVGAVRWATKGNVSSGVARALVQGKHDTTLRSEVSVIPSSAWSNGTRMHIWLASVRGFHGDT